MRILKFRIFKILNTWQEHIFERLKCFLPLKMCLQSFVFRKAICLWKWVSKIWER